MPDPRRSDIPESIRYRRSNFSSLTVQPTRGEKTIQTLGRSDPQIKTMVDAFGKLGDELQWEDLK